MTQVFKDICPVCGKDTATSAESANNLCKCGHSKSEHAESDPVLGCMHGNGSKENPVCGCIRVQSDWNPSNSPPSDTVSHHLLEKFKKRTNDEPTTPVSKGKLIDPKNITEADVTFDQDFEDGGWIASVPSMPGCVGQGETKELALADAREASVAWAEAKVKMQEPYKPGYIAVYVKTTDPLIPDLNVYRFGKFCGYVMPSASGDVALSLASLQDLSQARLIQSLDEEEDVCDSLFKLGYIGLLVHEPAPAKHPSTVPDYGREIEPGDVDVIVYSRSLADDWFMDVFAFHEKFGAVIGTDGPKVPDESTELLRNALIREESEEMFEGLESKNLVKFSDGAIDLMYVILGTFVSYGIDPRPLWREVQRTNMAKIKADGGRIVSAAGKILKPEGWTPPDIEGLLARQPALTTKQRVLDGGNRGV